jgi:hypothetical protein
VEGNGGLGGRIPAIFVVNKKINIANHFSGNHDWKFDSRLIEENKWYHIRLIQRLENNKYIYRVYSNGFLLREVENTTPQEFKQVDVWTSDPWHNGQPGFIKNLYVSGKPGPPTKQIIPYKHLGCWKDEGHRAIPTMEGHDPRLTGSYRSRDYAIQLCYETAKARGYHIFAVQHGGMCLAMRGSERYMKYGKMHNCENGKGNSWANDVYLIGELPIHKVPFTLFANKEHTIRKNSLVSTFPLLPKLHEVSVDIKLNKWIGGWTSAVHFTIKNNDGWGMRIPSFLPHSNQQVYISNGWFNMWSPKLTLNKWYNFKIKQTFERHEYVYRIYIDNKVVK